MDMGRKLFDMYQYIAQNRISISFERYSPFKGFTGTNYDWLKLTSHTFFTSKKQKIYGKVTAWYTSTSLGLSKW